MHAVTQFYSVRADRSEEVLISRYFLSTAVMEENPLPLGRDALILHYLIISLYSTLVQQVHGKRS